MNLDIEIELDPTIADIVRDLKQDVSEIEKQIVKTVAELAPAEMRNLMLEANPDGKTSKIGKLPAIRSGQLADSLQGKVLSEDSATIEMAGHAVYLDPFLGGKLNRPFVIEGIDRAVVKTLRKL